MLVKSERKKRMKICEFFSGGKINRKGHNMFLTCVDVAGGKRCVAEFSMDSRLQLKAVIVSDQSVPCSSLALV